MNSLFSSRFEYGPVTIGCQINLSCNFCILSKKCNFSLGLTDFGTILDKNGLSGNSFLVYSKAIERLFKSRNTKIINFIF
jgi:hypothetical protein